MIYVQRRRPPQLGSVGGVLSKVLGAAKSAGEKVARDTVNSAGQSVGNRLRAAVSATGAAPPPEQPTGGAANHLPLILGGAAVLGLGWFLLGRR